MGFLACGGQVRYDAAVSRVARGSVPEYEESLVRRQ
jgi:hypothetical protein